MTVSGIVYTIFIGFNCGLRLVMSSCVYGGGVTHWGSDNYRLLNYLSVFALN